MELYFTFPEWRRKAVSFSYDDAAVADRRLVAILNAHGLKGTFNITPSWLGRTNYVRRDEVKSLYEGHEIASHGYAHLHLAQLTPGKLRAELADGRRALEDLLGRPVTGFASPYGEHTEATVAAMREEGFAYARPASSSGTFEIPYDPLFWQATVHHEGGAGEVAERFLADRAWGGRLLFLNVWGHSYEFDRKGNWELMESLCALFDGRDDVWRATNLAVREYMEACRRVEITLDGRVVRNVSSIPLYANWGESHGTVNARQVVIPPGATVRLGEGEPVADKPSPAVEIESADDFDGTRPFVLAFPGWRRKALTFSYDDAPPGDRRLVAILNAHGLKGTFNVNTHGRPAAVPPDAERDPGGLPRCAVAMDEFATLYAGHEIALHGARHETFSSVPWPVVMEDVYRNKQVLESVTGRPVRGFAYPCGAASKTPDGDRILQALDVSYARLTAPAARRFQLPDALLAWHPTAHHKGGIEDIGRDFIAAEAGDDPLLCYIWGHSFEFDHDGNWDVIERFCALFDGHDEIWRATNIEVADYLAAARRLVWSESRESVCNPTATDIYGFAGGRPCVIRAGSGAPAAMRSAGK